MATELPVNIDIEYVSSYMKKFAKSQPSKNSGIEFEFLHSIVSPSNLRIRFEIIPNNQNATAWAEMNDEEFQVSEYNPKLAFTKFAGKKIGRVLLYNNKNTYYVDKKTSIYDHLLTFQANGIVLDSDSWDIIFNPSFGFSRNINTKYIADYIDEYSITPIADGTSIGLYYYAPAKQWQITTARGFSMNRVQWEDITFEQALTECLQAHVLNAPTASDEIKSEVQKFSLSRDIPILNCNYSYTIGFHHKKYHPFGQTNTAAWIIKATPNQPGVTLTELQQQFIDTIGFQKSMNIFEYLNEPPANYNLAEPSARGKLMQKLIDRNNSALSDFEGKPDDLQNARFGVILRAPANGKVPTKHISYMLESSLFKNIRQFIYDMPREAYGFNKEKYFTLRAYLNIIKKDLFLTLFPQYKELFKKKYDVFVNATVEKVLEKYKKKKYAMDSSASGQMATIVYNNIMQSEKLNPYDNNLKEIIRNYTITSSLLNEFMRFI